MERDMRRIVTSPVVVLAIVTIAAAATTAAAGDNQGRWGFGLQTGFMKLVGGDYDYSNFDQFGTLVVDYGVSHHWTFEAALKYGYTRPGVEQRSEEAGWTTKSGAPLYTEIHQPLLRARYHLAPDATFNPFLGAGAGATIYRVLNLRGEDPGLILDGTTIVGWDTDGNRASLKGTLFTFTLEGGADIFLTPSVAINVGARYHVLAGADRDNVGMSSFWGPNHVDANTGMLEGFLGLSVWFGNPDDDGDGILDKYDRCPDAKEDFDGWEDFDGCPDRDNDGDSIPDVDDACPDDAEDFDGWADDDGCPDRDNDRDGLLDGFDTCPDEAEDYDGFQDDDGCPDPDNDGDGVPDERDQCPSTPVGVTVGPDGCRQVPAPGAAIGAGAAAGGTVPVAPPESDAVLEGVHFVTGSAKLTPESRAALARVAESLNAYPEIRVEIRGHTDSVGPSEVNRDLSHRRAAAVRDALIELGVAPSRLLAVGYGEDYPIADNTTPEGRAKNRRVELHRIR
jgi:outer membrane protein OmpA-like peptidoglycan-associated protein/opacity protein-like surface antigen